MEKLRPASKLYISLLALVALGLGSVAVSRFEGLTTQRALLALAFAVLMVVVLLFHVPFAHRTKMTLDTCVIFATILLFPPAVGMLIAVAGTLLAAALRRRLPVAVLFNASQRALQAGAGGVLLLMVGWDFSRLSIAEPGRIAMVAVVATGMYAINTLSVATIIALQSGVSPLAVWRRSSWSVGLEYAAQLALGLMAAALVDAHLWVLPLLLLPAVAVYRSVERQAHLRESASAALRSSEASLATAQRLAHLGSWNRDLIRGEESWSDEMYRVLGYAPQQFTASYESFLNSIHPDDRQLVEGTTREAITQGTPYSITHRVLRPDGIERVVQQQGETLADGEGKPIRMMGTIHDITERSRAEVERDSLLEEVREALALNNRFLSITSHELKTPVTLLKGYTHVLYERAKESGESEMLRSLRVIDRQTERMMALINELLDLSRIQNGRLSFALEPLDLRAALVEVVADVAVATPDATIRLHGEEGTVAVRGDRMRLQQVMANLVTNAVKYSDRRKEVDVTLQCRDGEAVVTVTDYGIGIPKEQQKEVFEMYFRGANAQAGNYGGLGLGLHIAKAIVERHGGTIGLVSEEGTGSTFYFRLPLLQSRRLHGTLLLSGPETHEVR